MRLLHRSKQSRETSDLSHCLSARLRAQDSPAHHLCYLYSWLCDLMKPLHHHLNKSYTGSGTHNSLEVLLLWKCVKRPALRRGPATFVRGQAQGFLDKICRSVVIGSIIHALTWR